MMTSSRRPDAAVGCMVVAVVLVVVGIIAAITAYYHSTRYVTVKIRNESRSCTSKSCTNLVYTDRGVFKDSDALFSGKFNSSDIYGQLCPGTVARIKVRGWRQPILSEWPNILKVEEIISTPATCQ